MNDKSVVRALAPVDFYGQALTVIDRDSRPYVAMKPVVEGMGLAWQPQHRKLTDDSDRWSITMMVIDHGGDGFDREMLCMPLKKLTGWLMGLQPSRMDAAVAEKVLIYQNECDDALWDYWTKGSAVNPRMQASALALPDFTDPAEAAIAWAEQYKARKAAEMQNNQLVAKVAEDAPRVQFSHRIELASATYLVGQVAKAIQQGTATPMGQNRLFAWLREHGFLHRGGSQKNEPAQRCLDGGWMVLQVRTVGDDLVTRTPKITGKGLVYFYRLFYDAAVAAGRPAQATPPAIP
jgi:phage antirepressor YoqD-like protein